MPYLSCDFVIPDFFVIPARLESFFRERSRTRQDDRRLKQLPNRKGMALEPLNHGFLEPFEAAKL